jgi:hypothetical protein
LAWTATSDDFADAVRECAALPDAGSPTDAEIFRVADREIQTRFVPFLRTLRENYGVKTTTQTLTVGTAEYRIPSDAQGGTLRLVTIVDSAGVERNLPQVPLQYDERWNQNGRPVAFCVVDDKVRLFPAPDTAETLRMMYYRRPSKLVAVSSCRTITGKTSTTVTTNTTPSWSSGTPIDIVQGNPHFAVLVDGNAATYVTTTTTLVGGATTTDVTTSDYVCEHMTTCVVQLPAELYYALVSAASAQLLNSEGDQPGFMREMAQCERLMADARAILAPRVDGAPRVIVSSNSPLRGGRRRRGPTWDTTG